MLLTSFSMALTLGNQGTQSHGSALEWIAGLPERQSSPLFWWLVCRQKKTDNQKMEVDDEKKKSICSKFCIHAFFYYGH